MLFVTLCIEPFLRFILFIMHSKVVQNQDLKINAQENHYNDDVPIIIADNKRMSSIGWKPIYNIDSGLEHTIDWFKRNQFSQNV